MRFLYLFLIFLFSQWAISQETCEIGKTTNICNNACKDSCTGAKKEEREVDADAVQPVGENNYSVKVNGQTVPARAAPGGKFKATAYFFPGAVAPIEADEEAPDCDSGLDKATTCCNDPVTCLGGEHLSTFNQVNNIATQVGPGLSMLMQGTGKDMSGMCEALQAMAGAGAGLSTAALAKCKGSISSCRSACEKDIQTNCQKYSILKAQCEASTNKTLPPEAKTLAAQIVEDKEKTIPACAALSAKAGEIASNLGQMANSALSAELCKKQASAGKDKEECAKANGRWDGYKCVTQQDECEKRGNVWNSETEKCKSEQRLCAEKGSDWRWNNVECVHRMTECEEAQQKGVSVVWDPLANLGKGACRKTTQATVNRGDGSGDIGNSDGGGINLNTETPNVDNKEYDPDDPNNQVGGGGRTPFGISSGGSPGSSDPLSGLGSGSSPKANSPTKSAAAAAGKGGRYKGARIGGLGSGFRGRGSGERTPGSSDKDDPGLSMGGGGFSGYGGGGSGDDDDYASLGLSKKKLKELEKKAGAKRKTAGEGLGGAHQNIFERITKRFQSLCKNKLDCR